MHPHPEVAVCHAQMHLCPKASMDQRAYAPIPLCAPTPAPEPTLAHPCTKAPWCSHAQAHQVQLHGALSACTQQCLPVLMHQHTGASRHKCTYTPVRPCMRGPNTHRVSSKCVYTLVHLCTPKALTQCSLAPRHSTAVQGSTDEHALAAWGTHAQTHPVCLCGCNPHALPH